MNSSPENHSERKEAQYVFLIEDSDAMRQSLVGMLEFLGYKVESFSSAVDFLQVPIQVCPAVVITDMRMPDMTGVELQAELIRRGRQMPIVFISGESTVQQSIDAMKQGALEFLIKPFEREQLLAAVAHGLERDAAYMRSYKERTAVLGRLKDLTPRELEVFELMATGCNNTQIQEALQISLPTAKQYKSSVMTKLKVLNLAELIAAKKAMTP